MKAEQLQHLLARVARQLGQQQPEAPGRQAPPPARVQVRVILYKAVTLMQLILVQYT